MNATAGQAKSPPVRMLIAVVALTVASAFAVIYAKHETRKLFVELQGLHQARDDMEIEWGQLQLEQGTLATHGRVEGKAGAKLGMVIPESNQVVILQP